MKFSSLSALLLILIFINTGCAVSYLKNEYQASYTVDKKIFNEGEVITLFKDGESAIFIGTNCGDDLTYSVMMFPIVPLPPILPTTSTLDKYQIVLQLHGEDFTLSTPKMIIYQNGHTIELDMTHKVLNSEWIHWRPLNNVSCLKLNNAIIKFSGILYKGKKIELQPIQINIKDRGLSFGFEYYDN